MGQEEAEIKRRGWTGDFEEQESTGPGDTLNERGDREGESSSVVQDSN